MHLVVDGLSGMEGAGIAVEEHHIEPIGLGTENVGVEGISAIA